MLFRPSMRCGSAVSFVCILRVVQERAYIFLENFAVPFRGAASSLEQSRLLGALYAEVLNPDWVESQVRGYFSDWVESQVQGHSGRVQSLSRWSFDRRSESRMCNLLRGQECCHWKRRVQ